MNLKVALAGAGILVAGIAVYFARPAKRIDAGPTEGMIGRSAPAVQSVCVEHIQNLSHQPAPMEGLDDELLAQLEKVGFQSRKVSDGGSKCDAVVNAEIVELSGRGHKTARVDFRLTLTSEQVPRMSASATGKSTKASEPSRMLKSMREYAVTPAKPDKSGPERAALVAAFESQARQIDSANRRGLPPWMPKESE
jgi:hypothetical protein